jgi:hypothetical protein
MGVTRLGNEDNGSWVSVSPGTSIELALNAPPGVRVRHLKTGDAAILPVTKVTHDEDGNLNAEFQAVDVGETWIAATFQPLRMISRTRPLRVWRVTIKVQHPNDA